MELEKDELIQSKVQFESELAVASEQILGMQFIFVFYVVCCTLYVIYCILYIVYCILYIVYCILYIVYCILYIVYCMLYIILFLCVF